ncbi:alpha-ketoacid dehydrogenase subunit beta [Kordiimonas sp. SCSIO 12610]|uniref:alpha-ketoacid dehydrogenase subunit beta n=1 Tax=Kordiimonas sp. SCSIO 12610 TaxID=2829597 RepID=UPI00210B0A52|nr:transketolase C-terminal domain-containing protein [Kordiimonas sp. SCSIO 12610]UTW55325.1 alpha-ketoacid dehydrogenase subunit beta [Kordiimonas sp. SCSIO 12610]
MMSEGNAVTISEALRAAHIEIMQRDERVVLIGEDLSMGVFGVTTGLDLMFGSDRVINTPISETAFVGMALGAAMTGLRPIVEIMFCDFMGVCFDQIMNQIAKAHFLSYGRLDIPLVIRTTMGAGDGSGAMHSQSLHGLLQQIPGLVVACPATPQDAAGMLRAASKTKTPVVLMENKNLYQLKGNVDECVEVPFGQGHIVRGGADITLVAVSAMRQVALDAAEVLKTQNIDAEVIDPRTISPLDTKLIANSLKKTGKLAVIDEGSAIAGFADHVISFVAENHFTLLNDCPRKIVPPHIPVPYGAGAEQSWLPDVDTVVDVVRSMFK